MNIIDTIRVSGTDYTLSAQTSGCVSESTFSAYTATTDERISQDEEVTAAALNELNDSLSGKQDTLSAGTGIDITNNVISATGGGGKAVSAGTNISITTGETADTINCTIPYTGDPNYRISYGYAATTNKSQYSLVIGGRCNTTSNTQNNIVVGYDCHSRESHNAVFGVGNYSNNRGELSSGFYNVSNSGSTDADKTLFSVGNGTATSARHNAFEIRQNGDIYLSSGGTDIKLQDHLGGGGNPTVELTQAEYDALVSGGTVDPTAFYIITDAVAFDPSTKVDTSAITSSVTSASTNSEIPTAKAVYDAVGGGGGKAVSGGTNISITTGETADTINCTLPYYIDSGGCWTIYGDSSSIYSNNSTGASDSVYIGSKNEIKNTNISSTRKTTHNILIGWKNKLDSYCTYNGMGFNVIIGNENTLSGSNNIRESFVIGSYNIGNTSYEFICGRSNEARNLYETSFGTYNNSVSGSSTFGDSGNTLFSVGNGTVGARHNAFEIRQNGDIYLTKDGQDVKLQDQLGGGTVDQTIISGSTNAVAGGAVYSKIDEVEEVTAAGLNALNDAFGGLKLMKISQTDYDNLQVKDQNTLYIIVN